MLAIATGADGSRIEDHLIFRYFLLPRGCKQRAKGSVSWAVVAMSNDKFAAMMEWCRLQVGYHAKDGNRAVIVYSM
jgi:hypothetical protein